MNGNASQGAAPAVPGAMKKNRTLSESKNAPVRSPVYLTNGNHDATTSGPGSPFRPSSPLDLSELPLEIRQTFQGAFIPLSKLIGRAAQDCWKNLSDMVDQLAQSQPSTSLTNGNVPNGVPADDQSKSNLDKKDRLLNFAADQKANFIKLLVMLEWSKNAEDVSKALQINYWLHQQRQSFFNAAHEIGMMKRQLASFQVPNPDLRTAQKVLASQKVPELPDLGYISQKPLTTRQILRTFKSVNHILTSRLALSDDLPAEFQTFRVHDARVTFLIPTEFELDLTVMDADPTSRFHFLDLRFVFSPSSHLPEGALHSDISFKINDLLDREGLLGCYDFLHDMVLSYKLNVLHKQAIELSQGQFANHLRVELIRRTLIVQYWSKRPSAKSWLEIGIQSGRRKNINVPGYWPKARLHVRWIRELKEVEDAEIAFDEGELSMHNVLLKVLASHISHTFDMIYNRLMAVPVYADGALLLEQAYSLTEPSDCRMKLQLTKTKQTTMTIEPVTGSLILSPATLLSNRLEIDMRQSKNITEDVIQRLSHLRWAVAESDLVGNAESAGWEIVRTFKTTQAEIGNLFSDSVSRVVFFRQPYWEKGHMVAATYGLQGDHWWLLQSGTGPANAVSWTSQRFESRSMHAENAVSYTYLASLANYTSGVITLQTNAAYLAATASRFVLKPLPRFDHVYRLPELSLDFQPAKLRPMLSIEAMTKDWASSNPELQVKDQSQPQTWIRRTVNLTYCDFDGKTKEAVVMARGQSSASRKVLKQLADAALDPLIHISPAKRRFSIRLSSPVGKPVIEQLLQQLSHLENIIACLSVVQAHRSLSIVSLSTSHMSLRYVNSPETALGFVIHFASQSTPVHMELWPRASNPHIRIASQLTEILADPSRSLPTNLRLLVPLLTYTLPLLSHFQELQVSDGNENHLVTSDVQPRIHIIPRHATMYGVQYFAPASMDPTMPANSEGSPRMLARLEILPCQRSKHSYWILRPAIEQFESYNRLSFPMKDLNDRLREKIFSKVDEEGGWIALDQGAACPFDKPQRLLQVLHDLITKWVRDRPLLEETASNEISRADANTEAVPKQQPALKTHPRPQPLPNAQTNGNNQTKVKPGTMAGKNNAQKKPQGKEVIQLD